MIKDNIKSLFSSNMSKALFSMLMTGLLSYVTITCIANIDQQAYTVALLILLAIISMFSVTTFILSVGCVTCLVIISITKFLEN